MELKKRRDDITDVRGVGLMAAVELGESCAPAVAAGCLRRGLIVNPIGQNILRFLPPLIVKNEHVDAAIRILKEALAEVGRSE